MALINSIHASMQALSDTLTKGLISEKDYLRVEPLIHELLALPKLPITHEPLDKSLLRSYTDVLGRINKTLLH